MSAQKLEALLQLHHLHYARSVEYKNVVDNLFQANAITSIADLPYLPASIFKNLDLRSIPSESVYKTMTSSGTTGQNKSRIFLDKETASAQQKALIKIIHDVLGASRVPMLVLDSVLQIKNKLTFSARGAGIMGFMIFGTKINFALTHEIELDWAAIKSFCEINTQNPKLIYGFTSVIWQEVIEKLPDNAEILGKQKAVLIHGGGWKKLIDRNISSKNFSQAIKCKLGPNVKLIDYYGMIEQPGSIFVSGSNGVFQTNSYNDLIIRDFNTFEIVPNGQKGLIQVLSILPRSYPGYSILTEDVGYIVEESINRDGQLVKSFVVEGRVPSSEIRGCSNTYERL